MTTVRTRVAGTPPLVIASNIRKSFHGVEVLKGIDLTVQQGETICLIGPSGSGKSTLLRCLNLLERPDDGLVIVNDEPIGFSLHRGSLVEATRKTLSAQRSEIGMVFQNFNL